MSYILEALRKSELQRQRSGVPTLSTLPMAAAVVPRRSASLVVSLFGLLMVSGGMLIGWARPWEPAPVIVRPPVAPPSLDASPRPAAPPSPLPAEQAPPAVAVPEPAPRREEPPPNAPRRKLTTAIPDEHALRKRVEAAPAAAPAARSEPPVPQELPPMTVSGHVYSSEPRERIVSINDRLLQEGDALTPDLKLESITPDGMIFNYRGQHLRRGVP